MLITDYLEMDLKDPSNNYLTFTLDDILAFSSGQTLIRAYCESNEIMMQLRDVKNDKVVNEYWR